jgi:hypothetical protein
VIDELLHGLEMALASTSLSLFVRQSVWMWSICESLHFIGMSLLIGTIGMFDLRLLGFARGVPIAALHRLIPVGIAGFLLNAVTGFCFLSGYPDQYLFNSAFHVKAALILFAGFNILFFYSRVFRRLEQVGPDQQAPWPARIVGAVSLCAWIGVMSAGRLLTFFRPVFAS